MASVVEYQKAIGVIMFVYVLQYCHVELELWFPGVLDREDGTIIPEFIDEYVANTLNLWVLLKFTKPACNEPLTSSV